MKKSIIYICMAMALLISCNNADKSNSEMADSTKENSAPNLDGVWELVSFYNYDDDGGIDTIKATATNKQIKMYTESKVMWSRYNAADSTDWFGFGRYTTTDSTLTEVLDFGSVSMQKIIDQQGEFNFRLVATDSTFSQITIDDSGNPFYAENYRRIQEDR